MTRLLLAEVRKARTMLQIWIVVGGGIAYTVGIGLLLLGVLTGLEDAGTGLPPLNSTDGVQVLISQTTNVLPFLLAVGVLLITSEYRHQTITASFLVSPRRGWVVTAKFLVAGVIGLAAAAVTSAALLALVLPWLALADVTIVDFSETVVLPVVGAVVSGGCYTLLGIGLGALLRNQVAGLMVGLLWMLVAEAIIAIALRSVSRWTPGGASAALTRSPGFGIGGGLDTEFYLPMWAGGLLMLGYALALTAFAARFTVGRDVT